MEIKFIKYTNNQYSIREDGILMSHFKPVKNGKVIIRQIVITPNKITENDSIYVININGKRTSKTRNSLMIEYFGFSFCKNNCSNKIYKKYQYYCEKCVEKNCKKSVDNYNNRRKENITKSLVSKHLRLSVSDITDEIYELYKVNLKVKRLLSEKTGISTNLI